VQQRQTTRQPWEKLGDKDHALLPYFALYKGKKCVQALTVSSSGAFGIYDG
jgi:hypothetical protein